MVIYDDFNDGDMSEWSTDMATASTSQVWEGTHSMYSGNDEGDPPALSNATRNDGMDDPDTVSFYYWERSNNNSHGLGVYNGGNLIIGAGTENPNYVYTNNEGSNTSTGVDGPSYEEWVKVTFDFDWGSNQCDIIFERQDDGSTHTENNISFANSAGGIDEVRIGPMEDGDRYDEFYLDLIEYDPGVTPPSTPQNFSATPDNNDPDLSWDSVDWNGDQGHYNIYRGPVGGSLSEVDSVSSGTTSYDDTGASQDNEYDYAVEAENSEGTSDRSDRDSAVTLPDAPSDLSGSWSS